MEQQFSLSWNNFHGNLTNGFAGLLGKGEFVDVTIAVEGHLLQAHKVILSICSPYFKKMFQMNPCQHPIVVLRDVTHRAMRDLLQFMYHGEVSVKREDLTNFIGTAEVLQVKGLTNKESDDDDKEREPDLPKHNLGDHKNILEVESCISDTFEAGINDDVTKNNKVELLKQKQLIEKLHHINSLKRRSEEFLQKNYYTDLLNTEKRPKFREKPSYNKQNNYDHRNSYNESPVDTSSTFTSHMQNSGNKNDEVDNPLDHSTSDNCLELKTECEETDIVVTDPAIHKNYEEQKDLTVSMDYQSPQDSALSLVINDSCENQQLPVQYKYIFSRKGHKQLVHMNFVYTKHSTTHGKTSWRCVQYFSLNRCPATVETIDSMIYAVNHQHNHEDCYEKLLKNNVYEMSVNPK